MQHAYTDYLGFSGLQKLRNMKTIAGDTYQIHILLILLQEVWIPKLLYIKLLWSEPELLIPYSFPIQLQVVETQEKEKRAAGKKEERPSKEIVAAATDITHSQPIHLHHPTELFE